MVGPRPPECNCKCSPPVYFAWHRPCRVVGPQTPIYAYAAWTATWDAIDPLIYYSQYGFSQAVKNPLVEYKMAPMRYEIGKITTSFFTKGVGEFQYDVAVSEQSAPLDGHLDSSTIAQVAVPIPIFLYENYGGYRGLVRAIELFRNGVSVGVFDQYYPGVVTVLTTRYRGLGATGAVRWYGVPSPIIVELDPPLVVVETDVWSWDIYMTLTSTNNFGYTQPAFAASDGSAVATTSFASFYLTNTVFGLSSISGMKFTFASNGPGGITELSMVTQSGWTRTDTTSTAIKMINTAGTYILEFNWGREIPYILFFSTALYNNPSLNYREMRYIPVDSGDYDSHYVTASIEETYGKWSPAGATVFSNKRRRFIGQPTWRYTTTGDALDPGFPSSITVEPI